MRTTKFLLATLKESPADSEIISHKLMIRAGMIRKCAAGIYTWLPLGLRVMKKVTAIIREEMDKSNAIEVFMPAVQSAELWQESGRWEIYGSELLRIKDRHEREFCFGPTHEEVITDLVRGELRSYKQLPMVLYQIQTKFRDEIRPRFGVMRSREFLMKDAYSFHLDHQSLQETYDVMYATYSRIFARMNLKFRAVLADTGNIGGKYSHEFHVLAESGEDVIAFSNASGYAANIELAEALAPKQKAIKSPLELAEALASQKSSEPQQVLNNKMQAASTPMQKTIEDVCKLLKIDPKQAIKTLIVNGSENSLVALVLRGDHELNETKVSKLPQIATPLTFANDKEIAEKIGCETGFLGPVGLNIPIIVDRDAAVLADFVCGANREGEHLMNVNWGRDLPAPEAIADIRKVVAGDKSPDGKGELQFIRGIEVGHIFQLGDKYSVALRATVLNAEGKALPLIMGCYGIGVSRTVAAAIEQNHDERGIIWPEPIAPFQIALIPVSMHQSYRVREVAEKLYADLVAAGFEVLFDDRKERLGVLFADMDLIGIPHQIVIGEGNLDKGVIEYKTRREKKSAFIPVENILEEIKQRISSFFATN